MSHQLRFQMRHLAVLLAMLWACPTAVAAGAEGFIVLPDDARRFPGPIGREADVYEILATREGTGGGLGLIRVTVGPKSGPGAHIHRAEDEFFYILKGQFEFRLGDRLVSAPAGAFVFVPRGQVHTFQNISAEPGIFLAGIMPGGLEGFFAEMSGADLEKRRRLFEKYGIEPGPPLRK